jgi:hypothetical protein
MRAEVEREISTSLRIRAQDVATDEQVQPMGIRDSASRAIQREVTLHVDGDPVIEQELRLMFSQGQLFESPTN